MKNRQTSRLLAIPVFVAAMGVSPVVFAQYGTSPKEPLTTNPPSAQQYIDDASITAKVKAALISDPQVKATQVSVETDQGVVQLSGTIDSKKEESEALRIANQTDGVKSVKDLMNIKNTQEQ